VEEGEERGEERGGVSEGPREGSGEDEWEGVRVEGKGEEGEVGEQRGVIPATVSQIGWPLLAVQRVLVEHSKDPLPAAPQHPTNANAAP